MTKRPEAALVAFVLPLPPATNNLYTNGRGHGKRVLTTEARLWKQHAGLAACAAACEQGWSITTGPVEVGVHLVLKHDRDVDNLKALLDALSGVLYRDDRQIVRLVATKAKAAKGEEPRAVVTVREVAS